MENMNTKSQIILLEKNVQFVLITQFLILLRMIVYVKVDINLILLIMSVNFVQLDNINMKIQIALAMTVKEL